MAFFSSSTRQVPSAAAVPDHVAVIMDGNGRWAKKRFLPRFAGHAKGVELVREMVRACLERNIRFLTLFAFSSENWRRPQDEVTLLMQLFVRALEQEVEKLDRNGVRLRVIGDLTRFDQPLQALIREAEARTAANTRLDLTIAANYGGRWDVMQAVNRMLTAQPEKRDGWSEADLEPYLSMHLRLSRIFLFVPAVRSASAIFSCGNWLTRNCILRTRCGQNSTLPSLIKRFFPTSSVSAALVEPANN
jgi:undecaprenyl diphosphate synthase